MKVSVSQFLFYQIPCEVPIHFTWHQLTSRSIVYVINGDKCYVWASLRLLMQTPAHRVRVLWCDGQIHTDYGRPVEKKGWHGCSLLSEREGPTPCLDRLLLLFWVHYIEDGPHLLCTGLL